jgi:hypothetical protein
MRPDSITLAIFEKYSPEELAETAQKLVQALTEKTSAETEKKMSDSVFNERIKKHEAEAEECAKRYSKGGETAQIGCSIRYDMPSVGKKSYIRMDREEVVEVHDMSLEEKQETLQFPLTASADAEAKPPKKQKPKAPPEPEEVAPIEVQTSELTFKDIQGIAANIAKLPDEHRSEAIADMQSRIATTLRVQKGCIGPDGRVETIDSQAIADSLAQAWLNLAVEEILTPRPVEEVTRLCAYPACILFAEHDGDHEFPKTTDQPQTEAAPPEVQPERETKPKRKKRGYAPPSDPPCQEPPTDTERGFQ